MIKIFIMPETLLHFLIIYIFPALIIVTKFSAFIVGHVIDLYATTISGLMVSAGLLPLLRLPKYLIYALH